MVLGSFLPWASITAPLFGTVTTSGSEGDGLITALAGGAIALLAFVAHNRKSASLLTGLLLLGLALVGAYVGLTDLANIQDAVDLSDLSNALDGTSSINASVGSGLYLVAGGAVGAAIASVVVLFNRNS